MRLFDFMKMVTGKGYGVEIESKQESVQVTLKNTDYPDYRTTNIHHDDFQNHAFVAETLLDLYIDIESDNR